MDFKNSKQLINFVLACFLAALLVIFGIYIFSIANSDFKPWQLFVFGVILVLAGVVTTSNPKVNDDSKWVLGFLLIALVFINSGGPAVSSILLGWLTPQE